MTARRRARDLEPVALIALGGLAGAIARYLLGAVSGEALPMTVGVNAFGCLRLGLVLYGANSAGALLFFGVGFCGAFPTFSTFGFQNVAQWERGERVGAIPRAIGTLVVSAVAFGAAWLLVG